MQLTQLCNAIRRAAAVVAMASALVAGSSLVLAQIAEVHPAAIHEGACENLGQVAFELTAVGAATTPDGPPVPASETVGSEHAIPIRVGVTTLEVSLSKLVANDHAIVVYERTEATEQVVACGGVGGPLSAQMAGMVMPGDELAVGLAETEASGYSGIALIRAEGTKATVRIFLIGKSDPE